MIPERISDHMRMLQQTREWLHQHGSSVESFSVFMCRPMVVVNRPPLELVKTAQHICERDKNGTRSVWVASFNGCRIIWR